VTGYAIYSTINLHIRKRTCWMYLSCLLDCLQRRLIKYTYREICSNGSKYEYCTCVGNYLPDCTASNPPKTAVFRHRHICRLRWRRLQTFMRHETIYAFISCWGLCDISVMKNCGRSDITWEVTPPPPSILKLAVLPNRSNAKKYCGRRTWTWEISTDFNALRCYQPTSSVRKSSDCL
jgi:hypothetical protein